jgi:hypothetical protein
MSRLASAVVAVIFSHLDASDHLRAGRCSHALRQQSMQPTSMAPTMTIRIAAPVHRSDKLRVVPLQHLTLRADTLVPKYDGRQAHDVRHSAGAVVAVLAKALGKTDGPAPSWMGRPTVPVQNVLQRVTLVGFWRESLPSVARIPARKVVLWQCADYYGVGSPHTSGGYVRRVWSELADTEITDRLEAFRYPGLPLIEASLAPGRRLRTLDIGRLLCRRVDCETTFRTVTDLSLSLPAAVDQTFETVLRVAPLRRLVLRDASAYLMTRLGKVPRLGRTLRCLEIDHPQAMCLRDIVGLTSLTALRITEPHVHRPFAHILAYGVDYCELAPLQGLERLDLATTVKENCVDCCELTVDLPFLPEVREFRAPFDMSCVSLGQRSGPTGGGGDGGTARLSGAPSSSSSVFPRLERLHFGVAAAEIEAQRTDGKRKSAQTSTGGSGRGKLASLALAALPDHARLRSLHIGAHAIAERELRDLAPGGSWRARFPALDRVVGDRREILLAELAAYRLGRIVSLA